MGEHVEDGVGLAFDPETGAERGVGRDVVGFGFACIGDYVVVVGRGDGTVSVLQFAGEEVWKGFELTYDLD